MGGQGALRGLRAALWVMIVVAVPLYLIWLARVGYRAGHRLPEGDTARWAPVALLPPAAVVFCVMAGWTWWASIVARSSSPLRERWILATLAFTTVTSVFCGVAGADEPSVSAGLLSLVVTGLGMAGLFAVPAACSRQLPDVFHRRSSATPDKAAPQ
ncbi:hypothetical protein V2E29_26190 [Streptomyces diastatochromogenes]|uniref:hypothetical protein n=1 Tax=Streptomyces diastatochromogenes TaxID=42236 RepID=UPI002F26DC68